MKRKKQQKPLKMQKMKSKRRGIFRQLMKAWKDKPIRERVWNTKKHVFVLDGEKVEGVFPKFDSKFETVLPKELRTASDTEQFKYCTEKLVKQIEKDPELAKQFAPRQLEQIKNGEPRISGLTWHHNEIPGKMQLVDAREHNACRHTGGRSVWGGGADCR